MNLSAGLRSDAKPPVAQLCSAPWNGVTIDHLQDDLKPARRTTEPPPRTVPDLIADVRRFATEAHQRIDQRCEYTNQAYQEHLSAVEQGRRQTCHQGPGIPAQQPGAQDIVTYDWPQIARLARHIAERLQQTGGR